MGDVCSDDDDDFDVSVKIRDCNAEYPNEKENLVAMSTFKFEVCVKS